MPSAWGGTRQNIFGRCALALTVILPTTQHSAIFFKKITLPSAPAQTLGKEFLYFFKKNTLPSAPAQALDKVFLFFLQKILCRVPLPRHSIKFFYFFLKKYFAECPSPGTRQRISGFFLEKTLPSALPMALGKDPENCKKKKLLKECRTLLCLICGTERSLFICKKKRISTAN